MTKTTIPERKKNTADPLHLEAGKRRQELRPEEKLLGNYHRPFSKRLDLSRPLLGFTFVFSLSGNMDSNSRP